MFNNWQLGLFNGFQLSSRAKLKCRNTHAVSVSNYQPIHLLRACFGTNFKFVLHDYLITDRFAVASGINRAEFDARFCFDLDARRRSNRARFFIEFMPVTFQNFSRVGR